MSTTYIGADTFATSAQLPDDGDDISAASVNVPLEAALDRTTWLKNRVGEQRVISHGVLGIAGATTLAGTTQTTGWGTGAEMIDMSSDAVVPGDFVQVITAFHVSAAGGGYYRVAYQIGATGSITGVTGSERQFVDDGHHTVLPAGFTCGATGTLSILLQPMSSSIDDPAEIRSPLHATWQIYRSNS